MREVPLGSIQVIGHGIPSPIDCGERKCRHLRLPVNRIDVEKVTFGFISVFLTDVFVERLRNEIERSSARLRIWVRIEEIPIK